jgi:hypothetical protein
MKIQPTKTNKLFYGEYPYKAEFRIEGANLLRTKGIDWLRQFCLSEKNSSARGFYSKVDKVKLHRFLESIEPFLEYDHKIRAERSTLNYYSKDKTVINQLSSALNWCLYAVYEPGSPQELEFLTGETKKVLCDVLPHTLYKFKVTLKENIPVNIKKQFLSWALQYNNNEIKFTKSTEYWLGGSKHYVQSPYFYMADDKMLVMAHLFLSNHIKKVEEYIPRYTLISE